MSTSGSVPLAATARLLALAEALRVAADQAGAPERAPYRVEVRRPERVEPVLIPTPLP